MLPRHSSHATEHPLDRRHSTAPSAGRSPSVSSVPHCVVARAHASRVRFDLRHTAARYARTQPQHLTHQAHETTGRIRNNERKRRRRRRRRRRTTAQQQRTITLQHQSQCKTTRLRSSVVAKRPGSHNNALGVGTSPVPTTLRPLAPAPPRPIMPRILHICSTA